MNRDYWDQQDHRPEALFMQLPRAASLSLLLSEKGTDYAESTGAMAYLHMHKQLLLSAKLWKKANQPNKYSCISGSSSHSTFLPCADGAAGG